MSYFYVRNQNFIVIFKKSKKGVTCEVVPSVALNQAILDHPNLKYQMVKTYINEGEEEENDIPATNAEEDDEDIEEDKLNPNINFQKEEVHMN